MDPTIPNRWLLTAERCVLLALLVGIFCSGIGQVEFTPDESHWIHTSSYLEILFTQKISSPFWGEHYWTLTQPPLARYIIGLGRRLGNYNQDQLNTPWQFDLDYTANLRQGNLPEARLLWFSRLPMAVLAAVTGWLLYLLAESSAGRLAGYTLLALYSGSAYLLTQLRRAMSEAPLLFFTTLACVAAWRALKNWQVAGQKESVTFKNLRRPLAWFLVAGMCCGLAGASKINGLFAAGGVCLLIVLAVFLYPGKIPPPLRWSFAIRATILTLLVAMVIFIAANPFLYLDPFTRTVHMFKFRIQEMSLQVAGFPENVIHGPAERVDVISRRVLEQYASLNFSGVFWLNLALAGFGLVVLIKKSRDAPAGLAWLIVPVPLVVGALVTPLDWDRYYLFPVVYTTFFIAIGLGWAGHWLWGKITRMRSQFPKLIL